MSASLSSESLTLSAHLFHTDIDSWLPTSFGITRSDAAKAAEWENALRGAQRDRLGLGHPDLHNEAARARGATARAGLDALARMTKKGKREEAGMGTRGGGTAGSDSEEESRTRALGKKKKAAADVFGGKKKAPAAVHPLLNLRNPIPGYNPETAAASEGASASKTTESASAPQPPSTVAAPAAATPATTDATSTKRPREDDDDEVDTSGMSKTQARREKRRRAKAARKAEA